MRTARITIVALCFTVSLISQTASVHGPAKAGTDSAAAPDRPNVDAILFDLQRITVATDSDIADLDIAGWKAGWRTAWLKSSSHKQEAEQVADSVRRNLKEAMPALISEVQNSRGSVSSTFKLYNDLSIVQESLDSLIASVRAFGKKGETGPLSNDYAALGRIRQDLSSYIQVTAASLEFKSRVPNTPPSTSHRPKKVVVDDDAPATKPARKKSAALQH